VTPTTAISELLTQLSSVVHTEEFRDRHRRSVKDFVRDRILTLPVMMMFFLRLRGGVSLQPALDAFFEQSSGAGDFLRTVTKSALCQARQKFKASAFVELNGLWVSGWHKAHTGYERWCGLRIVAADGVCFRVPKWRENIDSFGWGPNKDGTVIMTRCLALLSTATKQFLHIEIGNYSQGERALLVKSQEAPARHRFAAHGSGLSGLVAVRIAATSRAPVLRPHRQLFVAAGQAIPRLGPG